MVNFKKVEKIVVANGWFCAKVIGSHYQYKHPNGSLTITIPNHNGKELCISIIHNLEKTTGLSFRR